MYKRWCFKLWLVRYAFPLLWKLAFVWRVPVGTLNRVELLSLIEKHYPKEAAEIARRSSLVYPKKESTAWLSIDTAPRNGQLVLGWAPGWETPCFVLWDRHHYHGWSEYGEGRLPVDRPHALVACAIPARIV